MAKKNCCLFENLMLGKLLNFFTDLPRVAYKMVAYKKKYVFSTNQIRCVKFKMTTKARIITVNVACLYEVGRNVGNYRKTLDLSSAVST